MRSFKKLLTFLLSAALMSTALCFPALADTEGTFPDVPEDADYAEAVEALAELGIFGGCGNGKFGPNDPVTQEQMMKMLVCAWGYEEDALSAGGWPDGYATVAADLGITAYPVSPAHAKRSEVAVWCYSALFVSQNIGEGDVG